MPYFCAPQVKDFEGFLSEWRSLINLRSVSDQWFVGHNSSVHSFI